MDKGKQFDVQEPVSYTHLTLPTTSRLLIGGVGGGG